MCMIDCDVYTLWMLDTRFLIPPEIQRNIFKTVAWREWPSDTFKASPGMHLIKLIWILHYLLSYTGNDENLPTLCIITVDISTEQVGKKAGQDQKQNPASANTWCNTISIASCIIDHIGLCTNSQLHICSQDPWLLNVNLWGVSQPHPFPMSGNLCNTAGDLHGWEVHHSSLFHHGRAGDQCADHT